MARRSSGRGDNVPGSRGSGGSPGSRSSFQAGRASDRSRAGQKDRSPQPPVSEGRSGRRAPDRPGGAGTRNAAEEIRSKTRPGQSASAVQAFEQAVALLQRDRAIAAVASAIRAKELAPRSGAVREILGIALYRAERFRDALRELQAYRRMTGRLDQNHLIADCYRALGAPEKALEPVQDAVRSRLPDEVRAEA